MCNVFAQNELLSDIAEQIAFLKFWGEIHLWFSCDIYRGGDLSENLGVLGNVGIWDCGAGGAKRPRARPQAERGRVREGVAPSRQGGPGV
jgi:hypothetical protein